MRAAVLSRRRPWCPASSSSWCCCDGESWWDDPSATAQRHGVSGYPASILRRRITPSQVGVPSLRAAKSSCSAGLRALRLRRPGDTLDERSSSPFRLNEPSVRPVAGVVAPLPCGTIVVPVAQRGSTAMPAPSRLSCRRASATRPRPTPPRLCASSQRASPILGAATAPRASTARVTSCTSAAEPIRIVVIASWQRTTSTRMLVSSG